MGEKRLSWDNAWWFGLLLTAMFLLSASVCIYDITNGKPLSFFTRHPDSM